MCDPLTLGALAVGGAGASAIGQHQQATTAHKWQQRQFDMNKEAATKSATRQYADMQEQRLQLEKQSAQEGFEYARDVRMAQASFTASATARGVEGGAVEDARSTFAVDYSESTGVRLKNLSNTQRQILRDMESIREQTHSRITSAMPGPTPQFNYLGFLGQAVGSVAGIAAAGAGGGEK